MQVKTNLLPLACFSDVLYGGLAAEKRLRMKTRNELREEITRWRNIQQNLSDIGVRYAVSCDPVLHGDQLSQSDVLALLGLVQVYLDDLAWQVGEDLNAPATV